MPIGHSADVYKPALLGADVYELAESNHIWQ
jgi:hypothetical protein